MNLRHTFLAVAVLALTGAAHAHDCSGGSDGGMDATGNQCNETLAIAAAPASGKAGPAAVDRPRTRATRAIPAGARAARAAASTSNGAERLAGAGTAQGR